MSAEPSKARFIAAFAAVYIIWGSTYLAIRFAIETLPPFLMAAARFLIAGALVYAWTLLRTTSRPTLQNWRAAILIGGLLLFGGNGAVVWAEQRVPSGVVALVVAIVPLWMVLLDWRFGTRRRPRALVFAGVLLGLVGLALLVGPGAQLGSGRIDLLGVLAVVGGSLSWAAGSIYARQAKLPREAMQGTAMEMLGGGALLLVFGLLVGEGGDLALDQVSLKSALAVAYLIVFGSMIAFSAYIWLLSVTTPARVATYAYVNPVVAVLLGWALADEPLTARVLVAAAVIVLAVAIITSAGGAERAMRAPRGMRRRRRVRAA